MAQFVEKTGRTVEEAIAEALEELNADMDKVEVEVLEEGNKGIFGLIGSKPAKVRVTLKNTAAEAGKKFINEIIEKMNVDATVEVEETEDTLMFRIEGNDIGILIGRRGETLDAIQYLTSLVVNKGREEYMKVVVDIENYRKKREQTLINLANRLAERVVRYKKPITLEPMNPYERRIIHSSLQNNKFVETYSIGDEPNRKVVIALKA